MDQKPNDKSKTTMASQETTYHTPVMLQESVDALDIRPDGTYVDVTFGGGGHSREILRRLGPEGRLIAFDQDPDALGNMPDDDRFILVHHNFCHIADFVDYIVGGPVDGVLGDLGVSSHHFDEGDRGFSFKQDGPLDMRMGRDRNQTTAADYVAKASAEELAHIFGMWGEVDKPFRVANAIVKARESAPIGTTAQLRKVVESVAARGEAPKLLTKVFQALRIEVNHEMSALEAMLKGCIRVIKPGGRMVMIAYHSLEDRMVKNIMKSGDPMVAQPEQDAIYGTVKTPFSTKQRKPQTPSDEEVERNPRARSAKMRWAVRSKN